MRASDLFVKCLEAEGVRRVFGIPGEENLDLLDSLIDSSIEFVLTRHENSAAFIAGAMARITGKTGVCLSTLGPGATNMVTGVAEAFLSYIPLIAITGQVGADQAFPPRKQYIDLVDMYRPVTKQSLSIASATRIPVQVRRAFDIAASERPGPVHLALPEDMMKSEARGAPLKRARHEIVSCDTGSLERLRGMLAQAEKPMVFAGPGIIRSGAADRFRAFIEGWGIPTVHSWHGAGIIPYDDPLSLNTVGLRTKDNVRKAFEEADLMLLVGYDVPEFAPVFWNIGRRKNIAIIDSIPAPVVPHFEPDIQVVGDIGSVLERLSRNPIKKDNWASAHKDFLEQCVDGCPSDGTPIKPQLAVKAVRQALGKGGICVSDVGAHLIWIARLYPVYRENSLLLSNGLIPMGIGVPWAIGAKLARPEEKVVAVCGDGGFLMTAAELETAKRLGTAFVTVIFNDSGLGLIKYKHRKAYGRDYGADFGNPDFVEYAQSFGVEGYRVSTAKELEETIGTSLAANELAVIDCPIDYSENKDIL